MKPTRECNQQERMLRALLVLGGMTFFFEDIMCKTPDTPIKHFVHDVYAIAHAAHGQCCGSATHSDWIDKIDKNAELLSKAGIMDLEKTLQEIQEGKRPKRSDPAKCILEVVEETCTS